MDKKNVLIVGAGVAGRELLRELKKHLQHTIEVVGFVDDDPNKKGTSVGGIKILGNLDLINELIKKLKIEEVFIAIPSAEGETIRRVIKECQKEKVLFKVVPRTLELVQGKVNLGHVRDIRVEDVLGRAIIKTEQEYFEKLFKNKVVLVTGAAGSIGSEICRQIAQFSPKKLIGIDWWESGIFVIDREVSGVLDEKKRGFIVGNIQSEKDLNVVFEKEKPDYVFHAAAFKHVPLMQKFPIEAVRNNVFGTLNVIKTANKHNVLKMVNISTDKAVDPTCVMGVTKLLGERLAKKYDSMGKTRYISVRFGNVLGSQGSVVPLFKRQIEEGGPVTVTDANMTRYFMTIPEAVQLVLYASVMGKGGELFVLDMGEPVKIIDLAELMIRLSGYIPGEDIKIKIVGKRPGEKLDEILSSNNESVSRSQNNKIFFVNSQEFDQVELDKILANLKKSVENIDEDLLIKTLKLVSPSLKDV